MLLARRLVAAWLIRLGSALRVPLRRIVACVPPPPLSLPLPLLSCIPYVPPAWASNLHAPAERIVLGHLPTPLMQWACPELAELGVQWVLKRDDMTGMELSGNKVRSASRPSCLPSHPSHQSSLDFNGLIREKAVG